VSITNQLVACAPEGEQKVPSALPFLNLGDCRLIKDAMNLVIIVPNEQVLSKVVLSVDCVEYITGHDSHVLTAEDIRVFMSVMDDRVATFGHHFTELANFLSKGIRAIFLRRDRVL
jgi:hypothetical protein